MYTGPRVKRKTKKKKSTFEKGLFWKLMFVLIELFGMWHIHQSYVLATQGNVYVLETLSGQIITEIVAPFITAIISKTIENIFEHNVTSFSKPIPVMDRRIEDD